MKTHICYSVGNGQKTNLWHDPWLPQGSLVDQFGQAIIRQSGRGENCKVAHLIGNGSWDLWPPTSYEVSQAWNQIKDQPLSANEEDEIFWKHSPSGEFTVKSAWEVLRQPSQKWDLHRLVWNNKCIPKMSFCNWLAVNQKLKTLSFLSSRGVSLDRTTCVLCKRETEDTNHLFFRCGYSKWIWMAI